MILTCIPVARHKYSSLCFRFFVFLYGFCVYARRINIASIEQELMCSMQFQYFLIFLDFSDESKANLKNSGWKTSPYFWPFWRGIVSNRFLPMRTSLWVLFKHILISLTGFIGILISEGMLYYTSLVTQS